MFFNISNHPSKNWDKKQIDEAIAIDSFVMEGEWSKGQITDIPFPNIPPRASTEEVIKITSEVVQQVKDKRFSDSFILDSAMVMGEFSACFYIIRELMNIGINVFVATTERVVTEKDGVKTTVFNFVQFREIKNC